MEKNKITKLTKKLFKSISEWVKKNKSEAVILALILIIGAFLRLYNIEGYMTFLGDEGRDAIVVRRLLVDFDPIFVGPGTSIGDMYLGPVYYYMMAPFLVVFGLHPVGPAVMIALLGVATIYFLWLVCKEWFGDRAGTLSLLITFLYAISPVVIIYSRSSWNPNIMPFFALLTAYSVWKFWVEDKSKWLITAIVACAITLQSHYLALLLIPFIGFFVALSVLQKLKSKTPLNKFTKHLIIGLGLFVLLSTPLLIFDAAHDWMNYSAMHKFFTQRQTTVSARPWTAVPKMLPLFEQYATRILAGKNEAFGKLLSKAFLVGLIFLLFRWRNMEKKKKSVFILLLAWLFFAFVGLGVYKQHIYDHYFGFIYPAGFLLLAGILSELIKFNKKIGSLISVAVFGVFAYYNILESPIRYQPNNQYNRAKNIAEKVIEVSDGQEFNFAVIAKTNYETGYTYFFELWHSPNKKIIADRASETITDQLLVICELPKETCNPQNNDRPEVTQFGWSQVVADWDYEGVTIYKLIHTE